MTKKGIGEQIGEERGNGEEVFEIKFPLLWKALSAKIYYNIMGRSKIEERNTRKLAKVGNGTSYSITLPIDADRTFKWQEK